MNARRAPDLEDDRLLVSDVLARVPGAFERLVGRFQGLCWHIVSRMVRDREDARDLCQETFLRVHRYLHQYRSESALSSWVGQVAYNTALRHLERKRIPLVAPSGDDDHGMARVAEVRDDFDLEAASANAELMSALHAAIDELPPLQRAVVWMRDVEGWTSEDVSEALGITPGNQRVLLHRGRQKVRAAIQDYVSSTQ